MAYPLAVFANAIMYVLHALLECIYQIRMLGEISNRNISIRSCPYHRDAIAGCSLVLPNQLVSATKSCSLHALHSILIDRFYLIILLCMSNVRIVECPVEIRGYSKGNLYRYRGNKSGVHPDLSNASKYGP